MPSKTRPIEDGEIVGWFYDHLARLIYAHAASWKPENIAQLRDYVDSQRKAHYLEGFAGEYTLPNWSVYERESRLYADIESYGDGESGWSSPARYEHAYWPYAPQALRVVEAMSTLGMFTPQGLKATSVIWGQMAFTDSEHYQDAQCLTELLLKQLIGEQLPSASTTQEHVDMLYNSWQLPMYDLEFSRIPVSLEELQERQEAMLWAEIGSPY